MNAYNLVPSSCHPPGRLAVPVLFSLCFATSCGGGGGAGGGTAPPVLALSVSDSLARNGINTSASPRLGDDRQPLPADYIPFSSRLELERLSEMYVVGINLGAYTSFGTLLGPDPNNPLLEVNSPMAPWLNENSGARPVPKTLRDVIAADVDGDGLDEIVTVYVDGLELRLNVRDDLDANFQERDELLRLEPDVQNIAIASGDFNADGFADVAVGLVSEERTILFVEVGAQPKQSRIVQEVALGALPLGRSVAMRLAAGNLDDDRGEELVVVENGLDDPTTANEESRYFVFDDAKQGFALFVDPTNPNHLVQGELGIIGMGPVRLDVSDVSTGDIDGDGRDEILLGGLENLDNDGSFQYVLIALDDFETRTFEQIAIKAFDFAFQSARGANLRFVHVNCLDIDGDRSTDIQFGHFVFKLERGDLVRRYRIPDSEIFPEQTTGNFWYDISTSSMAVGDLTGDGREDIVTYRQGDTEEIARRSEIYVYGFDVVNDVIPPAGIDVMVPRKRSLGANPATESSGALHPILLCPNVNRDSRVLRYVEDSYRLAFTEPIVVAAIAAPPCIEGIGQNTGDCVSTFGNSESTSTESERSVSVSASASVGIKVTGGALSQSELELKLSATIEASSIMSNSYSLTRSRTFTSGANENTVIFTTIPMDEYSYEVVTHPTDPSLVGSIITINLPRDPITVQVEQSFYNANIKRGGILIDDRVFRHGIGDAHSYPSVMMRDSLMSSSKNGRGLSSLLANVGQGSGSDGVELAVGSEYGSGEALSLGFTFDVEVTGATVLAAFSVGATQEDTLTILSGTETTYGGSVGRIPSTTFAQNQYSFGLFTYVQRIGNQEFEVINYWVE